MTPAQYDIQLYRGDYFELMLRLRDGEWDEDGDEFVPGPPKDLTDWTVKAQIRATNDTAAVLAAFDATILDQEAQAGAVQLVLSSEDSAALPGTSAVWDCQLTDPDDRVFTYVRGKVSLKKDVTR